MELCFEAACGSNKGMYRRENEDNVFFGGFILPESHQDMDTLSGSITMTPDEERAFSVAVFDGMGGRADGQTASYVAAKVFQKCLDHGCGSEGIPAFLSASVQAMNKAVADNADHSNTGMGTTAVILCFSGETCTVCNVGDSKAFLLRGGELTQLSFDHTDALTLQSLGVVGRKPRLTQYIGMREEDAVPEPFLAEKTVFPGDRYLICSDGVTDIFGTSELTAFLRDNPNPAAAVDELIHNALNRDGKDNITAIMVWVSGT